MPQDPDDEERADLLRAAYSRDGQADPERMRDAEARLRAFARDTESAPEAGGAAGGTGAADAGAAAATADGPRDLEPAPERRLRRWMPALLLAVGLLAGAGIATAVPIIAGATAAPTIAPGAIVEPVTSPLSGRTVLPRLIADDLPQALDIFARPATPVKRVPADIAAQFDAANIHRIFEPSANGGGFDVFVVRKDVGFYCLVLLRLHEKYVASCGTEKQISTDGMRLLAITDPPTTSSEHLAGGPTTAPTTPDPRWQVEITWNVDGTFSLSGAPFDGKD